MSNISKKKYSLSATTQGPLYPPAEVMNADGNFVVVGMFPDKNGLSWSKAIVSHETELPFFGDMSRYKVVQELDSLSIEQLQQIILYTLPLPIPMNNYQMLFAPEQNPNANTVNRKSMPLHDGHIFDGREIDGKRNIEPINLYDWLCAEGELEIHISADRKEARFNLIFEKLVPNSLYTVMCLRECDLSKTNPTRPGPLGVPNVFITDEKGNADFWAIMPNPFPIPTSKSNRIVNIVVLFMSSRQSYGGAIGMFGLGGDIHAHMKLKENSFSEFITIE